MVSKIPTTLVSSLCLLSVIANVLSSNPDSEMVQYPVSDTQSAGKKSMKSVDYQNGERRPALAVVNDRYAGVKVLRPYYTGLGIVWREIATTSGEETIRIRDRGSFLEVTKISRNNLTRPVEFLYPQRNTGYAMRITASPNVPNGYVSSNNVPKGNVRNRYLPNSYVPNGSRPNGNAPNNGIKGGVNRSTINNRHVTPQPPRNNHRVTPSSTSSNRISPDANLFSAIVNDFTFKMVRNMRLDSNFVVSPLSIFTALSMLYLGSGGRTKAQLEQILGLNDYAVHGLPLHRGVSDLLSMMRPESSDYELLVASGLFFGKDFAVEEPFLEDVKRFYSAEVTNLDFSDSSLALKTINDWVAKKTKDNIPTLIESALPEETRLILMNAIFFKGAWEVPFPEDATFNGTFYSTDGSEIKVPFMTRYRGTFKFHRSEEHKHTFVKLPYQGGQVSMIIALPFENEDAPMPFVTDQILCHVQDAMRNYPLGVISVPRFRVEYLKSLKEPLENMGLNDLFGRSVNLTEMRKTNDIFVSEILHKAVIDVDEKGTTASAATEVQIVPLSGGGENFVANHPFAFYVVHDASGLVLFSGQVHDPSKDVIFRNETTQNPSSISGSDQNPAPQNNRREYFGRRV